MNFIIKGLDRAIQCIFRLDPMTLFFGNGEEGWEAYFSLCEGVENARYKQTFTVIILGIV
ncbi:hypothetical protein IEQ34_005691 [Dendrobium chrysotoxum]|uniref:Uncharacterized protein n=1 Tax=Dendrobium chrysotoxum TaxID=161865 RepID=A0AAV7HDS4_DENCH|nr:hypothetical protein IEQ34_005691 [Dendrobium chrysotoxum]